MPVKKISRPHRLVAGVSQSFEVFPERFPDRLRRNQVVVLLALKLDQAQVGSFPDQPILRDKLADARREPLELFFPVDVTFTQPVLQQVEAAPTVERREYGNINSDSQGLSMATTGPDDFFSKGSERKRTPRIFENPQGPAVRSCRGVRGRGELGEASSGKISFHTLRTM